MEGTTLRVCARTPVTNSVPAAAIAGPNRNRTFTEAASGVLTQRSDVLAALQYLVGNGEERFQFWRHLRGGEIRLHRFDKRVVSIFSAQVFGGGGAMGELAESTVVSGRDKRRDRFPLGQRQFEVAQIDRPLRWAFG
jgi:hypothetical protein